MTLSEKDIIVPHLNDLNPLHQYSNHELEQMSPLEVALIYSRQFNDKSDNVRKTLDTFSSTFDVLKSRYGYSDESTLGRAMADERLSDYGDFSQYGDESKSFGDVRLDLLSDVSDVYQNYLGLSDSLSTFYRATDTKRSRNIDLIDDQTKSHRDGLFDYIAVQKRKEIAAAAHQDTYTRQSQPSTSSFDF